MQECVLRPDAGIVQPGGDGVRVERLPVLVPSDPVTRDKRRDDGKEVSQQGFPPFFVKSWGQPPGTPIYLHVLNVTSAIYARTSLVLLAQPIRSTADTRR